MFFDTQGRMLKAGRLLGRGGEASVYELQGDPNRALKVYHAFDAVRADKLREMIANAPLDPTRADGHVSIAWPEALLFNDAQQVIGFVMPRIDTRNTLPLHQLYHPKARLQRAPGITWRYLVRIAHNLCTVVAALHAKGYVVGDLNESNVLVSANALVTLVDCDSVQVQAGRTLYPCTVGKPEFTPAELQGKVFRQVRRTPNHDAFALAVLIFMLLMEGNAPFAGVYRGEGDPPGLEDNIKHARSPYLGARMLAPGPVAPPFTLLPNDIRRLFKQAFKPRLWRQRPDAHQWQHTLKQLESGLLDCSNVSTHVFPQHLACCPWCVRHARIGIDAYPDVKRSAPSVAPSQAAPIPALSPLPAFKGSVFRALKTLPVLSVLYLGLSAFCVFWFYVPVYALLQAQPWFISLNVWLQHAAVAVLLALFVFTGGIVGFIALKRSPILFRALWFVERTLFSLLIAAVFSVSIALLLDMVFAVGSPFSGQWLFVLPLAVLGFWVTWRLHK